MRVFLLGALLVTTATAGLLFGTPSRTAAGAYGQASLATLADSTCALTGGGVKCWGRNSSGQLGDGTTTNRLTPVFVCRNSDCTSVLSGVVAVSARFNSTCAVTSAGGVKCWGRNDLGQLGDNTTTSRPIQANVSGLSSGVIAVDAGLQYACALMSAGGVKCWGRNDHGQLGDNSTTERHTPVDVCADSACASTLSGVVAISAGDFYTCALMGEGRVKCWGINEFGQLGDNSTTERHTPADVCVDSACASTLSGAAAIAAGQSHACALTSVGGLKCWGRNQFGELGDNTSAQRRAPVDVCANAACASSLSGVAAVSAGTASTCTLNSVGGVKCWGSNQFGQLGDNTLVSFRSAPVDVCANAACAGTLSAVAIAAGPSHACALTAEGGVKCWGSNSSGQLGATTQAFCGPFVCSTTPLDVVDFVTPVGGVAELPDLASSAAETSSSGAPSVVLVAGIAGALVITLGGTAWYARRRWTR